MGQVGVSPTYVLTRWRPGRSLMNHDVHSFSWIQNIWNIFESVRLSGGYVMHYTAFRDGKDRDVCVAVCADEFGETTPFVITRLIEAVSALR